MVCALLLYMGELWVMIFQINRCLGLKRIEKDEFYIPMPTIMSLILVVSIIGCVIFTVLYKQLDSSWLYSCAITFGMFSYHIILLN